MKFKSEMARNVAGHNQDVEDALEAFCPFHRRTPFPHRHNPDARGLLPRSLILIEEREEDGYSLNYSL